MRFDFCLYYMRQLPEYKDFGSGKESDTSPIWNDRIFRTLSTPGKPHRYGTS
jgi:hypothetical protein